MNSKEIYSQGSGSDPSLTSILVRIALSSKDNLGIGKQLMRVLLESCRGCSPDFSRKFIEIVIRTYQNKLWNQRQKNNY